MAQDRFYVGPDFVREFLRMRHWIDTFNGSGVTNTRETCSVAPPPPAPLPRELLDRLAVVRVTGAHDGYGKYKGKIVRGGVQPAAGVDWKTLPVVVPDDGQSLPDQDDCYLENLAEEFKTTWNLAPTETEQVHHVGIRGGFDPLDGKPIFFLDVEKLPRPQYQYQVIQAVAQNVLGFSYVKAHAGL